MKKLMISFQIIITTLSLTSCGDNLKLNDLTERIKTLENKNRFLKDSINKLTEINMHTTQLLGIPKERTFKKNKEGEILFCFLKKEKTPIYNVYESDRNHKKGKLLYSNIMKSQFEHKFIPTKTGENEIILLAEIKNGKFTTTIPAHMSVIAE